jgi:Protein of unknown function (DUF2510)
VTSTGSLFSVLVLVIAALFGALSYVRTVSFRRRMGRNPWGIHPLAWLAIGCFLGIFGMCLALLACATTRTGPSFQPMNPTPGQGLQSGSSWSPPLSSDGPPAGWYPDPSGHHHYRFFTGHDWTADVVDDGVHSTEPLPTPPGS